MEDWTDAFGWHDASDEECHSGSWRDHWASLSVKRSRLTKMSITIRMEHGVRVSNLHLMYGEPDLWKGDKPGKEEPHEVSGSGVKPLRALSSLQ